MAKMQPFWYFLKPPLLKQTLPVLNYVLETDQWEKYGVDPWLNINDGDTNAIGDHSLYGGLIQSYFNFSNTTVKTPTVVKFGITARSAGYYGRCIVYLWDGSTWTAIATCHFSDGYETLEFNVESLLNTQAKINAARLKLVSYAINYGLDAIMVTYAYLYVEGYG